MFSYHLPTQIIVGQQAAFALYEVLSTLSAQRLLLVSDTGLVQLGVVEEIQAGLSAQGREVAVFSDISTNPSTVAVAAGLALAREMEAQVIVALGGGSPIDVAKGIAMLMTNGGCYADYQWGGKSITQRSLPLVAVPTTAGTGSEVSKVAVIVDPERPFKKGVLSSLMFPHSAVIDAELTRSLPKSMTAATGMDTFIHALEAYTGRRSNPYTDMLSLAALKTTWWALPRAVNDGDDMQAREAMMLAALWAGTAMDHAGLGLIHSLSGALTGQLHLHHGLTNAILLPHILRFNLPEIKGDRIAQLKQIVGLSSLANDDALIDIIENFVIDLGLPTQLSTVTELTALSQPAILDTVIEDTLKMAMTPNNPRETTAEDVKFLIAEL
ncbi:MAG: iron-containing alcohol dehydrogenase [Chloroflexi bacterium]|nr:iron-containing alcohol dehydrogenase [Chloroflexota bacterium]